MNNPVKTRLDRYTWPFPQKEAGPVAVVESYSASRKAKRMSRHLVSAVRRRKIGESQEWKCWYCQQQGDGVLGGDGRKWHVDHMHPLSRGGDYSMENLALACATCNLQKGDMTAREFRGFIAKSRPLT